MCSTAFGSSPFACPTFQIASSCRGVMLPVAWPLVGRPGPGRPLGAGRVPLTGPRAGGGGAGAGAGRGGATNPRAAGARPPIGLSA